MSSGCALIVSCTLEATGRGLKRNAERTGAVEISSEDNNS